MASRLFRTFAPEVMIAFSLALVAVAIAGVFLFEAESQVLDLLGWIDEHEFWGPCIFALVYMLVVIFVLPGLPLTLGAGFLFGIVRGSLFVIVAVTAQRRRAVHGVVGAPSQGAE